MEFAQIFRNFLKVFTNFVRIYTDFARIFRHFARIFTKSEHFGVGLHPLQSNHLHHWQKDTKISLVQCIRSAQ